MASDGADPAKKQRRKSKSGPPHSHDAAVATGTKTHVEQPSPEQQPRGLVKGPKRKNDEGTKEGSSAARERHDKIESKKKMKGEAGSAKNEKNSEGAAAHAAKTTEKQGKPSHKPKRSDGANGTPSVLSPGKKHEAERMEKGGPPLAAKLTDKPAKSPKEKGSEGFPPSAAPPQNAKAAGTKGEKTGEDSVKHASKTPAPSTNASAAAPKAKPAKSTEPDRSKPTPSKQQIHKKPTTTEAPKAKNSSPKTKTKSVMPPRKQRPPPPTPPLPAEDGDEASEWAGVASASDEGVEETELLHGFSTDSDDSSDADDTDAGADPIEVSKLPTVAKDDATVRKKLEKAKRVLSEERGVVYLGRIPHGMYEDQLRSYFSQFGDVTRLRLSRNKKTGRSKFYAFIEFASSAVAEIVAETMHNYLLAGHILICHVIPKDQVHPELWVGANRRFRVVPSARLTKFEHDRERSDVEKAKVEKRLMKRQQKNKRRLEELGIEYDIDAVAYKKPKA